MANWLRPIACDRSLRREYEMANAKYAKATAFAAKSTNGTIIVSRDAWPESVEYMASEPYVAVRAMSDTYSQFSSTPLIHGFTEKFRYTEKSVIQKQASICSSESTMLLTAMTSAAFRRRPTTSQNQTRSRYPPVVK